MSCKTLLHCCLALAFLRGLTTDLIHYIFCVEFLDQIEEEMEYINSLVRLIFYHHILLIDIV